MPERQLWRGLSTNTFSFHVKIAKKGIFTPLPPAVREDGRITSQRGRDQRANHASRATNPTHGTEEEEEEDILI